jgi:hypothetical protein
MRTLLLILMISLEAYSQEWAPIGAEWKYTRPYSNYTTECMSMKSIKDTVIQDSICRVLRSYSCADNTLLFEEYIHQYGDSIYYYNYHDANFYLLYDFSAQVNDVVVVHPSKFKATSGFLNSHYLEDLSFLIRQSAAMF